MIPKQQGNNVSVGSPPGVAAPRSERPLGRGGARLPEGTILQGRYRITGLLGVGGMSVVYRALDLRFANVERVCAIKEMFDAGGNERTRRLRLANFEREAGLLAVLSHPLIPKIYDFFSEHDRVYLVQEFVPGRNLEALLAETPGGFVEDEVIGWGTQVCDVLTYLHGQRPHPIIFRDLKPSNMMVRDDRTLMLIDFGIARTFQRLQRGTMIGTEGYAPPEQYRGHADPRVDIYALGATLHHLATGSDPRYETPFTFAQRPPRALNPRLSAAFEQVILKAVAYAPEERYATVAEFKAALLECQQPVAGAVASEPAPRRATPLRILPPLPRLARVPARTPPTERLVWSVATGDEVRGGGALVGGLLSIGSYDGQLYALDRATGAIQWRFATGRGICATPVVWHDTVIVGSEDGAVYGVALASGEPRWRYRTNMPVRSSPRAGGNAIYIGSDDSYIYKLDAASGALLWRYRTYGPVRSSAALVDDTVLIGSDDGFIYALAGATGRQVWRFATPKPVLASPVVAGDVVVCGSLDGAVYGLGVARGEPRWRYVTGGPVVASAALAGGAAYVGSSDGEFVALDLATGERRWRVAHGGRITSSAVVTGERVYYGGLDGVVYCLDRESGALVWSYAIGRPVPASPVLAVADELLFIGGTDGKVYALALSESLAEGAGEER